MKTINPLYSDVKTIDFLSDDIAINNNLNKFLCQRKAVWIVEPSAMPFFRQRRLSSSQAMLSQCL